MSGLLVSYGDTATRGCFARTIAERAAKVRLLADLGKARPVVLGEGAQLRETDEGLHATFAVPEELSAALDMATDWPVTVRTQRVGASEFKLIDVRLGLPGQSPARSQPAASTTERRISADTARRRLALLDLERA
ncbi:MAG: hypothetical protein PGN27_04255 [Mycolicibacterium neoaurum]|uniref:hypothetical protein n=1 Tax=Mycolicibacterium neoaurum TaxID=1795 RepID=UPI002FFD435D